VEEVTMEVTRLFSCFFHLQRCIWNVQGKSALYWCK